MDEAERCHHLAILDRGVLVAEGAPATLARDIPAQIVEIATADPLRCRRLLDGDAVVEAVTQLGNRLRVMLPLAVPDPASHLRERLAGGGICAQVHRVEANLEDVFVAATKRKSAPDTA